jgi:signal transduction histidine kinase
MIRLILALSPALLLLVGWLDVVTGPEIGFSAFYLPPIALVAWASRSGGIFMSFLGGAVWVWSDIASGQSYSHFFIHYWNGAIRLSIFLFVSYLLSAFRHVVEKERWTVAREQRRLVVALMEQAYEPLRSIMGNATLLASGPLPAELKLCVVEIEKSAARLHSVLLKLRDLKELEEKEP